MPNWCDNNVTLTHSDKAKIDALETELQKTDAEVFKHFRPYEGEWDYGWCCENWGCKWEARIIDWNRRDDNSIWLTFETAWAPPVTLYEFIEQDGWEIEAFYYEPGMAFAGIYSDGYDNQYNYSEMSADEIEEQLPQELNEMYGISDYQREWEEENQEDEEYNEEGEDGEEGEYTQEDIEQALAELKAEFERLEAEEEKKNDPTK